MKNVFLLQKIFGKGIFFVPVSEHRFLLRFKKKRQHLREGHFLFLLQNIEGGLRFKTVNKNKYDFIC